MAKSLEDRGREARSASTMKAHRLHLHLSQRQASDLANASGKPWYAVFRVLNHDDDARAASGVGRENCASNWERLGEGAPLR
jgi:hypothetical protein